MSGAAPEMDPGTTPSPAAAEATASPTQQPAPKAAVVPRFLTIGAQWAWRGLIIAAAIYVLVYLASMLRFVVIPIFLAIIVSALLGPVVEWMSRRMPRLLATWVVALSVAGTFVALLFFAIGPIVNSVRDLFGRSEEAIDRVKEWLRDGPLELGDDDIEMLFDRATEAGRSGLSGVSENATSTALLAGEILGAFFLSLVLTFFFLKDGPDMWSWFLRQLRPARREPVDVAGRAATKSLQGWVRGTAITGVVDGVIIGAALWILGVPAALPLALFTVLGAFFPIVGATIAGALAAGVALADSGPQTALIVIVIVLVVQQVEGDLLLPLIMYRQVSLHPAVILLALAAGAAVGGIVGALVSVPLTAAMTSAISAVRDLDRAPGDASDHNPSDDRSGGSIVGGNDGDADLEPAT